MIEENTRISEVKEYTEELFGKDGDELILVKNYCYNSNLPQIQVPSHVGKLINIIVQIKKSKNVLEIGIFGGYSTIWIAKGLKKDAKITKISKFFTISNFIGPNQMSKAV